MMNSIQTNPQKICRMSRISFGIASMVFILARSIPAQENSRPHWKNSLFVGSGMAVPGGGSKQYMFKSALVRLGYSRRLSDHFQADMSLDAIVHGAHVKSREMTSVGKVEIRDNEYLVCFGGRAVLPLGSRFEFFSGGGGAYMRYSEEAGLPSGITVISWGGPYSVNIDCPTCKSRAGWAYYGTAGGNVVFDRRRRVWLGLELRLIKGTTSGDPLGSGSRFDTREQWVGTTVNLRYDF